MILIADSGSTKTDWIALNYEKKEVFRLQTLGLNPSVIPKDELKNRINNIEQLINIKNKVDEVHFYGAGCGTAEAKKILLNVIQGFFNNAKINIAEDLLAAVYASSGNNPAIVCILGTGSNSCYFDGKNIKILSPSLGYTLMDEASGNYFGKILLRDFYYKKMPEKIALKFNSNFNLNADFVKLNLYRKPNPNMYLASFAKFMFEFKNEPYIKKIITTGIEEFFNYRILPYEKTSETPIYFVGSIAFYFKDIIRDIAIKNNLKVANIIQRPINNLLDYHRKLIK